jgi:hypothetical protein
VGQIAVRVVLPAARERDLAGVASEVVAPLGEDGVRSTALVQVERHEDGGVGATVDVELGRRGGVEERPAERSRELSSG